MGIHWQELVVILLIALIIFGPRRLPEVGSSLGRSIRGFRDSLNGRDDVKLASAVDGTDSSTPASAQASQVEPVAVEVVEPPSADR